MLHQILSDARKRFHPLYRLRKNRFFVDNVMPIIDVPVWSTLHRIKWKVRVHLIRHLSWIVNNRSLEPGIGSLFLAIQKTIRPSVFWDVGAHIGFYSWLMLSVDDSMHAVLFEPDPDHAVLITRTILESGLTRAQLVRCAVSDSAGFAEFALDKSSGATGSLETNDTFNERLFGWKPDCTTVETISLDQASETTGARTPDLIKIDVEMCEHLVFRGAQNLLRTAQPMLIFECTESNKPECLDILHKLNYFVVNADEPDASLDTALNFLALPPAHLDKWDELLRQWKLERKTWNS